MNLLFVLSLGISLAAAELPSIAVESNQWSELQTLIRQTEERDVALKAQLKQLQQDLSDAYTGFDLDEGKIRAIHRQIVDTQEKLLMNYHTLQFGFRKIIGADEFENVKKRIDHYVATADERRKKEQESTAEPEKPTANRESRQQD